MPICMKCNYKFQFVRRGVEDAAPYVFWIAIRKKVQPCKRAAPFLMPIFSALAHQADIKFHSAANGLYADTLVVAVQCAAFLGGQIHG